MTRTESLSSNLWKTNSLIFGSTLSPKNTRWGLRSPPQLSQEGTWNWVTRSSGRITSPSGAAAYSVSVWKFGFAAVILSWRAFLLVRVLQFIQMILFEQPWSSVRHRLPAFVWRASTFWVTNQCIFPTFSHSASTRWDWFGKKELNWGQPT